VLSLFFGARPNMVACLLLLQLLPPLLLLRLHLATDLTIAERKTKKKEEEEEENLPLAT
jgi:hypothetical protein